MYRTDVHVEGVHVSQLQLRWVVAGVRSMIVSMIVMGVRIMIVMGLEL